MNADNVSTEAIDSFASDVGFNSDLIMANVNLLGNWVGGHVYVAGDRVTFSTNGMNQAFQRDGSDLVVPTAVIADVRMGKMMKLAKTVDCDVAGSVLRFRCWGATNDRLSAAFRTATLRGG